MRAEAEAARGRRRGLRRGWGRGDTLGVVGGEKVGGTKGGGGMGRGRGRGEVVVGGGKGRLGVVTGGAGERSEGARVWTHSATSVTEEVWVAPPSEVYRRVGTQPAWSWGPVWSRLPSPGAKRRRGRTPMTWHRPRSGSSKTRPIKSVPSGVGNGRVEVGEVGSGGGRSDSAKWKKGSGKWASVKD